ncbi:MAG TPA: hypothetical protein VLX92_15830 [Kofleriaceae bacterium]|nr:hypothetical protein [Kofleriaceae bacterium]
MRKLLVVALAVTAHAAWADPAEDRARSDQLFEEGKALEKADNLLGACAKYEQALALNRNAVGTILNVALCDEKAGKVASAYNLFSDARDRAREQNLEHHEKAALEHLDSLRNEVPHLAVAFSEPPSSDTELLVNGQVVPIAKATDVLVDPGTCTIVVSRPGRVPFETKVAVARAQRLAVAVPMLAPPVVVKNGRRTVGMVLTFSGAGVTITGIVLGLYAKSRYDHYLNDTDCNSMTGVCGSEGYAGTNRALTLGNAGTAVTISGLVVTAIGGYLWVFAHHDEQLTVAPSVGADHAGIIAIGRF